MDEYEVPSFCKANVVLAPSQGAVTLCPHSMRPRLGGKIGNISIPPTPYSLAASSIMLFNRFCQYTQAPYAKLRLSSLPLERFQI